MTAMWKSTVQGSTAAALTRSACGRRTGGGGTLSVRLIGDGVAGGRLHAQIGPVPPGSMWNPGRRLPVDGREYACRESLCGGTAGGTHELLVPGFQEAIGFTPEPAPVYESLLISPDAGGGGLSDLDCREREGRTGGGTVFHPARPVGGGLPL